MVKYQLQQPVLWIFSPQIASTISLTPSLSEGKLFKSPTLPQTEEFCNKETAWVRYLSLHTAICRAGERSRLLVKTAAVSGSAKEKKKKEEITITSLSVCDATQDGLRRSNLSLCEAVGAIMLRLPSKNSESKLWITTRILSHERIFLHFHP